MAEDQQRHQEAPCSPQNHQQKSPPKERKSIHELRNQDYVSRLLAATPPYLYSAPVGPNNFFFSDMLRSLVQARNNENARNLQIQQAAVMARRPRKRSWSQHRPYFEHLRDRKGVEEKPPVAEKPLELTNKQFLPMAAAKYPKPEPAAKDPSLSGNKPPNDSNQTESQNTLQESPAAASLPPQDLVLPPPPPVWYPPIYPPYGIDPLHFFIDLRVSGHIYDRKKENVSPLANASENNTIASTETDAPGKYRHGSAFTVPVPRSECKSSTAINLSSSSSSAAEATNKLENYAKYYDLGESKENHPTAKSSSNYVLQNLPRLYSQFNAATKDLTPEENLFDTDNKSDQEDSIEEHSCEVYRDNSAHIDVEMIESTKFHNDEGSTSPDDCNITQHDD